MASTVRRDDIAISSLRLATNASADAALASNVRPALVLPERETRELLKGAQRNDVGADGRFAAGPAGIQVWSGPFDGPGGTHGSSKHLGSVDWSYDTPIRHYAMIYRVMVTSHGVAKGETTASILKAVLDLAGLSADGTRLSVPMPPQRDPFRFRG
jgi:hypothetical protein